MSVIAQLVNPDGRLFSEIRRGQGAPQPPPPDVPGRYIVVRGGHKPEGFPPVGVAAHHCSITRKYFSPGSSRSEPPSLPSNALPTHTNLPLAVLS